MNWLEIKGYFINLDNIAFICEAEDETQTKFGFIGGQSMDIDIDKPKAIELITKHHEDRGIK